MDPYTLLALLSAFTVKHFFCDYLLQTPWMLANKSRYGHPGGLAHVALHGLGSIPVLWIAAPGIWLFAALLVAEAVVHYHIDFIKARVSERTGWTPADRAYWAAFGIDQSLHHATYLAMVAALL